MVFGRCRDDLAILYRISQCDEDGILGELRVAEVVQRVGAADKIGEEVFGGGANIPLELRFGEGRKLQRGRA